MLRDVVTINESLCDGCGLCVPACAEGALQIIDGKARLVADNLCDGLGACLGHCPKGAIKVEKREAGVFDEAAVRSRVQGMAGDVVVPNVSHSGRLALSLAGLGRERRDVEVASVCAGLRSLGVSQDGDLSGGEDCCAEGGVASELAHWPVQLQLLPSSAPVLRGAKLLIAADCAPIALAEFHSRLLRDHAIAIACPKLGDRDSYIEKLARIFAENSLERVRVARMEVPCCAGLTRLVLEAHERVQSTISVSEVVVSTRGEVISDARIA